MNRLITKHWYQPEFGLQTRYSNYAPGAYRLKMAMYENYTPALIFESYTEGPILTASVALAGFKPGKGNIFIKDWSENEGIDLWMRKHQLILGPVLREIPSGFVRVKEWKMGPPVQLMWDAFLKWSELKD